MSGQLVGYARVSTTDQDLTVQLGQLEAAGCQRIFAEKRSGTTVDKREELARCLEYVREGDTLVVAKVDRLGRSLVDLAKIVEGLQKKGVKFRALDQNFDVDTPGGKAMLQMLMVFAELENSFRRQRQMEGIAAAKERGVYDNKRTRAMRARSGAAKRLLDEGYTYAEAAAKTGLARYTLYRKYPGYKRDELPEDAVKKRAQEREARKAERLRKEAEKAEREARTAPEKPPEEVVSPVPDTEKDAPRQSVWGRFLSGVKR